MSCYCLSAAGELEEDNPLVQTVLRRDGFRCVSCTTSIDVGVHSLIPSAELIPDISITICPMCHWKIGNKKIRIKNNLVAKKLLLAWAERYPKALRVHRELFPDDLQEETNVKTEESKR